MIVVFLLHHIPFDCSHGLRGGENRRVVHGPLAEFLLILEMDKRHAPPLLQQKLHWRIAPDMRPVHVNFSLEIAGLGRAQDPFECRPPREKPEFGVMIVKGELQAEGTEGFPEFIQQLPDFLAGRDRDELVRRPPRHHHIMGLQQERLADNLGQIGAKIRRADMHATHLEAGRSQSRFRPPGVKIPVPGQFDRRIADLDDGGDRPGEVGLDLVAQRPELE